MEELQMILTAISTVGFPIVVCLIMIYLVWKQNESHNNETHDLRMVIESNTNSITKLYEKIDSLIDMIGRGLK